MVFFLSINYAYAKDNRFMDPDDIYSKALFNRGIGIKIQELHKTYKQRVKYMEGKINYKIIKLNKADFYLFRYKMPVPSKNKKGNFKEVKVPISAYYKKEKKNEITTYFINEPLVAISPEFSNEIHALQDKTSLFPEIKQLNEQGYKLKVFMSNEDSYGLVEFYILDHEGVGHTIWVEAKMKIPDINSLLNREFPYFLKYYLLTKSGS